jgi:dihydroorotate dehydrogenase (fumarate)
MRLPLRWVAILYGKINASLAITSGVHNYEDVLKSMMAGANVAMLCSELLKNGISRISEILTQLKEWMENKEYESIKQMQGSMSQKSLKEPIAYNRANYMKVLYSYHLH